MFTNKLILSQKSVYILTQFFNEMETIIMISAISIILNLTKGC